MTMPEEGLPENLGEVPVPVTAGDSGRLEKPVSFLGRLLDGKKLTDEKEEEFDWASMTPSLREVSAPPVTEAQRLSEPEIVATQTPFLERVEAPLPVRDAPVEAPTVPIMEEPAIQAFDEQDFDIPEFLRKKASKAGEIAVVEAPALAEGAGSATPKRDEEDNLPLWMRTRVVEEPAMAETLAPMRTLADLDDDYNHYKLTESPPTSPEAVGSFADRVARARAIAGGAEKGVEVLLADLTRGKEASEFCAENRWEPAKISEKEVEWSDQKIKDAKQLGLSVANNFEHTKEMETAFVEIERQIREQEGYKTIREYAAGLTAEYGPLIKKTVKELTPGWFVTESALQKEMGELQNFFEGLGELGKQEQEIEYWEKTMGEPIWNLSDDKRQKAQVEKLAILKENVVAYQNLSSLLTRKEAPEELKNVVSVALDGENYDFGEGAIGDFRKRIYTDILKSLGLELGTGAFAVAETETAGTEVVERPMEEERFDIEFGELDQQEAERIGTDIGKGIESGMAGGRSPEVVAAVLKRKNAGREKTIAHGIRAAAFAIEGDRGLTVREKKQRWDYLHGIAESFFGVGSAGSSILDAIINEIISLSAQKG